MAFKRCHGNQGNHILKYTHFQYKQSNTGAFLRLFLDKAEDQYYES